MSVAGRRTTSELRQSNNRDSITSEPVEDSRAPRTHAALDDHRQLAPQEENLCEQREIGTYSDTLRTLGAGRQSVTSVSEMDRE
jgi:hypothetical protein